MEKQKNPGQPKQSYTIKKLPEITIPDFKFYYRATVMKTAWFWHKNKEVNQWNLIEDLDINPHAHENPIFDKEAKIIQCKKESIFNIWCWHNWMSTCRKMKINPYLSIHMNKI